MGNYILLKEFIYHLKNYFLQNPEKLPDNLSGKELYIKLFQKAWADTRLEHDHHYVRYMDVLFSEESGSAKGVLYSYIITYVCTGNIIDVMKMEFKQ